MAERHRQLARLHLVWLWLATCVTIVAISEVTAAGMLDGGFGSALFGLLFLVGAPFVLLARVGVALTTWAPVWLQTLVSGGLVLVATALADRAITRWLERHAVETEVPPN